MMVLKRSGSLTFTKHLEMQRFISGPDLMKTSYSLYVGRGTGKGEGPTVFHVDLARYIML